MNESTKSREGHYTACAGLTAIGAKVRQLNLFGPIHEYVWIAQKTFKRAPTDKLYDGWISLLTGAQGLVENHYAPKSRPSIARRIWSK